MQDETPSPPTPSPTGRGGEEVYKLNDVLLNEKEGQAVMTPISKLAGSNRRIPKALLERARELRKQQTPAEELLWECLRNRRLLNTKFRRQHNIGRYIIDFYCHEKFLIIEVDGNIHDTQQAEDTIRENWLKANGFQVIRFSNEQILNHLEAVLNEIANVIDSIRVTN